MKSKIISLIIFASAFLSTAGLSQELISISARHVMIMQADLNFVYGSYYFGVLNHTQTPQRFQTPIMLPNDYVSFHPADQLDKSEIKTLDDGTVQVDKKFPPGLTITSINFKVKINKPNPTISFKTPYPIAELNIASPKAALLKFSAFDFNEGVSHMLNNGQYEGILGFELPEQKNFTVLIEGIPRDRDLLWVIALSSLLLLVILAYIFTLKKKQILKGLGG